MSAPGTVHEFQVVSVDLSDDDAIDGVAVVLTDVRGGKVRLHLSLDMAEALRERVAMALDRRQGP